MPHGRPSRDELTAAIGRTVPDVVGPGLRVLFCGINPSLWSAVVGHHFAHPSNRFWKAVNAAGFTAAALRPEDEQRLLDVGVGLTNLVDEASRSAAELEGARLRDGVERLGDKVRRWQPAIVGVLGLGAFRTGFGRPRALLGRQPDRFAGAVLWVVPNPSGLQAHYPFERVVSELRELRSAADADDDADQHDGATVPDEVAVPDE